MYSVDIEMTTLDKCQIDVLNSMSSILTLYTDNKSIIIIIMMNKINLISVWKRLQPNKYFAKHTAHIIVSWPSPK